MTEEDKKDTTADTAAETTPATPETDAAEPAPEADPQPAPEAQPTADAEPEAEKKEASATPDSGLADEAAAAMGFKTDKSAGSTKTAEKPAEPPKPATPDWKTLYSHTMADFENFRKRTARDREDLVKFAASDVIKDMLTTVDNLALALDKAKDKADDPFVKGVQLVYDGLIKKLADHGATPLDSVGEPFDANFHEALAQLPSPTVEEGHVMNEVKRGWLLHGKLLRAAQVVVSAGKGE